MTKWRVCVLVFAASTLGALAIDIRPVLEDTSAAENRSFAHHFSGGGDNASREFHDELEASVIELWQAYDEGLRGQVDNLLRQALPYLLEIGDVGIDIGCAQSLLKIVFGLRKLEKWAFQRESIAFSYRRARGRSLSCAVGTSRVCCLLPNLRASENTGGTVYGDLGMTSPLTGAPRGTIRRAGSLPVGE